MNNICEICNVNKAKYSKIKNKYFCVNCRTSYLKMLKLGKITGNVEEFKKIRKKNIKKYNKRFNKPILEGDKKVLIDLFSNTITEKFKHKKIEVVEIKEE